MYPESVSVDVRFTTDPGGLPYVIAAVERIAQNDDVDVSYPVGETLPHEHIYPRTYLPGG